MMKYEQYFMIFPRKPIYVDDREVRGLGVLIESELMNGSAITDKEKLWSLYLDYDYTSEEDLHPLFFLPSQHLLDLIDENKGLGVTYHLSFEMDVLREKKYVEELNEDISYCDTLSIDDSTFFELLRNELHFNDEGNMPCEEIEL